MYRWMGSLLAMMVVMGAAEADDLGKQYADYDLAFRDRHKPTIHAIPRGPHALHAREYSPSETKAGGAPIILMHGFPDSLHLYDRLAPLLAKQNRVIAFDFLGWGNSDKPREHTYNVASLRVDLESVIAYFDFDRVRLVVHDASGPPGAMSLSLLKFVGQASQVVDAMLPS